MKILLVMALFVPFSLQTMDWPEPQEGNFTRLPDDILLRPILEFKTLSSAIAAIYNLNRTAKQFRNALNSRSLRSDLIRQLAKKFQTTPEVVNYLVELALANHATLQDALKSRKLNDAFIKNFSNQRSLRTLINSLAIMYHVEPIVLVLQWASVQKNIGLDTRIIKWIKKESRKSEQTALILHQLEQGSSIANVNRKRAISLLKSAGIKYQSISDAVKAGDIEALKELFEKPIDPNEGKEFSPALDIIAKQIEQKHWDVIDLRFQASHGISNSSMSDIIAQLKIEINELEQMVRLLLSKGAKPSSAAKKILDKRLKMKN